MRGLLTALALALLVAGCGSDDPSPTTPAPSTTLQEGPAAGGNACVFIRPQFWSDALTLSFESGTRWYNPKELGGASCSYDDWDASVFVQGYYLGSSALSDRPEQTAELCPEIDITDPDMVALLGCWTDGANVEFQTIDRPNDVAIRHWRSELVLWVATRQMFAEVIITGNDVSSLDPTAIAQALHPRLAGG